MSRRAAEEEAEDMDSLTLGGMANDIKSGGKRAAQPFNARHLDIVAFAEAGASLSGEDPLSHYARLSREDLDGEGKAVVRWQTQGRSEPVAGGAPEIWLDLQAQTEERPAWVERLGKEGRLTAMTMQDAPVLARAASYALGLCAVGVGLWLLVQAVRHAALVTW